MIPVSSRTVRIVDGQHEIGSAEPGHIPPRDIWRLVNGYPRAWEYHIDFGATAGRRQRDVSGTEQIWTRQDYGVHSTRFP